MNEAILAQLSQKSTLTAVFSAVALLVGWKIDPGQIDAIATLLALFQSLALAVLQERSVTVNVPSGPAEVSVSVSTPAATTEK